MLGMEARPQGHHDCVQRGAFYSETFERKGALLRSQGGRACVKSPTQRSHPKLEEPFASTDRTVCR